MAKSKKELDRDMMFRKIMPALADNPFANPVTDPVLLAPPPTDEMPYFDAYHSDVTDEEPLPAPQPPPAHGSPSHPEHAQTGSDRSRRPQLAFPTSEPTFLPEEEDDLAALRARLFTRAAPAPDMGRLDTVNLMEILVLKYLDEVLLRFNCCPCDRCSHAVATQALNQLPPQYVAANLHMDAAEETPIKKRVFDALIKSVLHVRAHPSH